MIEAIWYHQITVGDYVIVQCALVTAQFLLAIAKDWIRNSS